MWLFLWNPGEFEMLGANEFRLRRGFACGKTLVRRKRAAPLCGAPVWAGIYTLRTTQKERHAFGVSFFLGSGGQGCLHPSEIQMLGVGKAAPAQLSAVRRFCGAAQKGRLMIWQRHLKRSDKAKKEHQPAGWCSFFASRRYSHTRHRWMPCRAGKLPLPGAFALFKGTCTQLSSNIPW